MSYDPLYQWHKDKAKSSFDEAFNTANYATGMWKCETDNERAINMLKNCLITGVIASVLGGCIYLMTHFLP